MSVCTRPRSRGPRAGKFVVAVVHQSVDDHDGAVCIRARIADEYPPRRLVVVTCEPRLIERAVALGGLAFPGDACPALWPADFSWPLPERPPLVPELLACCAHVEQVRSALGWRLTLHAMASRHRDAELILAVCPPLTCGPALRGRAETIRVPATASRAASSGR